MLFCYVICISIYFFSFLIKYNQQENKDVLTLVLGKHNLTSPISSYSRPEIVTKSQSYFFTHSVRAIAVTSTAKGITSKHLLIGTIGDQVCCFFVIVKLLYLTILLNLFGLRGY